MTITLTGPVTGMGDTTINTAISASVITNAMLAEKIGVDNGGTNLDASAAANGALLIGNGSGFSLATLTGTSNQVTVTNSAGSITLSLPQSVATSSTPQFARIGVGSASPSTVGVFIATSSLTGVQQTGLSSQCTINSSATTAGYGVYSQVRLAPASFTCTTGAAYYTSDAFIGSGATLQYLIGYDSDDLTAGTVRNIAFRGRVNQSGSTSWNLYMAGTAPNYLAQNTLIGTTTIPSSATCNLVLGGGTTSPVLGAATADSVNLAAVDKAAGDRRLYIQSETGSVISLGNDRLNFAASTGSVSIGGTDILSLSSGSVVSNQTTMVGTSTVPSGATYNVVLGGGSTTPVLGAATADCVSVAAVDKAAGDRRLYIQSETGSAISLGNDRLNFAASTGSVSIGGTDVLSISSSTVTLADAKNIAVGSTNGTQIGTSSSQKLGFWGATPVAQMSTSLANINVGYTQGTDPNVLYAQSTLTGTNDYSGTAYSLGGVIWALKQCGILHM